MSSQTYFLGRHDDRKPLSPSPTLPSPHPLREQLTVVSNSVLWHFAASRVGLITIHSFFYKNQWILTWAWLFLFLHHSQLHFCSYFGSLVLNLWWLYILLRRHLWLPLLFNVCIMYKFPVKHTCYVHCPHDFRIPPCPPPDPS